MVLEFAGQTESIGRVEGTAEGRHFPTAIGGRILSGSAGRRKTFSIYNRQFCICAVETLPSSKVESPTEGRNIMAAAPSVILPGKTAPSIDWDSEIITTKAIYGVGFLRMTEGFSMLTDNSILIRKNSTVNTLSLNHDKSIRGAG